LILAHDWAQRHGVQVHAATVNHGLRPEAAREAEAVAQLCAAHGVPHQTLCWDGWSGQGNLQAAAREARYRLLRTWAEQGARSKVLLGHTADDQAETVLMALIRGSGVDGLAGMRSDDALFCRPVLGQSRAALRDYLTQRDVVWCEDPSNDDPRFQRVAVRQALEALGGLGLTQERLLETAAHMARAQKTLRLAAERFVRAHVRRDGPDLLIPRAQCNPAACETQGRVLALALQWIGGGRFKPRFQALCAAAAAACAGQTRTLNGVMMIPEGVSLRLAREPEAAQGQCAILGACRTYRWDHRWRVACVAEDVPANLHIRALGATISARPNWRDAGLPRRTLMASPAIFTGESLVAAPLIDNDAPFQAQIDADFTSFVIAH